MRNIKVCLLAVIIAFLAAFSRQANGAKSTSPFSIKLKVTLSPKNNSVVMFNAKAPGAAFYDFNFGNGQHQTSAIGQATCKYQVAGTYTIRVTAKNAVGGVATTSSKLTVKAGETLIWSDEFERAGAPDTGKWGYDLGNNNGWGNNELEYYTNRPENVIVADGKLRIILKKEDYNGYRYTSARLLSKGKFNFKYGRVEFKAKLPSGGGTWPALWALGSNVDTASWPACGEIDIMEHVGNQQNKIFATLHYPKHYGANGVGTTMMVPTASSEFHVYSLEWTATQLKFAVDGKVYHTVANNPNTPFNNNFFLIMNVAMGGNFGGAVDPTITSGTMEVEYVRVYK